MGLDCLFHIGACSMLLVTGAGGFLGHFVTQELLQRGIAFRGLVKDTDSMRFPFPVGPGDLGDPSALGGACHGASGLIHLASTLSSDPLVVLDQDVRGLLALTDQWAEGPFLFASSMDVYPASSPGMLVETSTPDPDSWYGLGKLMCEKALQLRAGARRFPHIVFRIPYIIGAHSRVPSSAFGRLIRSALNGDDVVVHGPPAGTSWVSARDVAHAMVSAMDAPHPGVFNIASGWTGWRDAAQMVIDVTDSTSRVVISGRAGGGGSGSGRRLDTGRIREVYGFEPTHALEDELRAVVALMRESQDAGA